MESSTVLPVSRAIAAFGESRVRWMIGQGRWQRPFRGVIVTHSGPLSDGQKLQAILLAHGEDAALGGLTAAAVDGLAFYASAGTHIVIPSLRQRRKFSGAVVHRSQSLTDDDVHPLRQPRRTRLPRSIVDAASCAHNDLHARAIIAASVQQRLTRPADLRRVAEMTSNLHRRPLILETITDAEGGSHSVNELDFLNLCRNFGLPLPDRQVRRRDEAGWVRYLDSEFDAYRLVVGVDGMQHIEVMAWWPDLLRMDDVNVAGKTVLRYPGFIIRHQPEIPAGHISRFMQRVDAARGGKCEKRS